ncbi:MAG: hypothetical protein ACOYOJ_05695 [Alsobacter sp.]
MQALRSRLVRFRDDCRGAFGIFFAVALLPLAFAAAFAVEHTYMLMQRDKLQSIVDSLVLHIVTAPINSKYNPEYNYGSGSGSGSTIDKWIMLVHKHFIELGRKDIKGFNWPSSSTTYDKTTKTVSFEGSMGVPELFGPLFRPQTYTDTFMGRVPTQRYVRFIKARASGKMPVSRDLEIALVFDVTGSMNRPGKWTSAVAQAKTFVSDMMKSPGTTMAIVPFGDRVPVDRLNSWSPPYNTNSWPKIGRSYNWYGLIRNGEKQDIKSLQWPIQSGSANWMAKSALEAALPGIKVLSGLEDTFCPELPGAISTLDDTPPAFFVAWLGRYDTDLASWVVPRTGGYRAPLPCPDRRFVMQPLTDSEADLQAKIDMLVPWDLGTRIDHGLLWGWYNLSPKWRGRFNANLERPGALPSGSLDNFMFNTSQASQRPTATAKKALVMFTDGENTRSPDYYRCKLRSAMDPSVFCENDIDQPPPPDNPSYVPTLAELNSETLALCSKIKAAGIEIFYVQYQVTSSVLNGCATDSSNLFNAADGNQLSEIFAKIRDKLKSSAYLSK